jgi:hypothetical protein
MMNVSLIPSCACAGPMIAAGNARAGALVARLGCDDGFDAIGSGLPSACVDNCGENDVMAPAVARPHGRRSPDYDILKA